jgi:hypothetical protein
VDLPTITPAAATTAQTIVDSCARLRAYLITEAVSPAVELMAGRRADLAYATGPRSRRRPGRGSGAVLVTT